MDKNERDALAADLALARAFGLKGFAEPTTDEQQASTPITYTERTGEQRNPDDASADLALARAFGLAGFTDEPAAAK